MLGTPSTGLSSSQPFKIAKRKKERKADSLRFIVAVGTCEMRSHRLYSKILSRLIVFNKSACVLIFVLELTVASPASQVKNAVMSLL